MGLKPVLPASDPCHLSRGARVGPRRRLDRHVVERTGISAPVRAGEESEDMNVLILRIGAGVAAINDEVLDPPTPHRACDLIAGRIDSATTHRRPLAGLAAVQTGGTGDVTQGR